MDRILDWFATYDLTPMTALSGTRTTSHRHFITVWAEVAEKAAPTGLPCTILESLPRSERNGGPAGGTPQCWEGETVPTVPWLGARGVGGGKRSEDPRQEECGLRLEPYWILPSSLVQYAAPALVQIPQMILGSSWMGTGVLRTRGRAQPNSWSCQDFPWTADGNGPEYPSSSNCLTGDPQELVHSMQLLSWSGFLCREAHQPHLGWVSPDFGLSITVWCGPQIWPGVMV